MRVLFVFVAVCIAVALCQQACHNNHNCDCYNHNGDHYFGDCRNGVCHCHNKRQGGDHHVECVNDADCTAFGTAHCHHHGQTAICHHGHNEQGHDHGHCQCQH